MRAAAFEDLVERSKRRWPVFAAPWNWIPISPPRTTILGTSSKNSATWPKPKPVTCARLGIKPDFIEAHTNYGNLLLERKETAAAIACFRHVLALAPDYAVALVNLGAALKEPEQLDEAIHCLRRALQINPNLAEAHINLGIAYKKRGRLGDAMQCLQQGIALNPHHADAYDHLGLLFKDFGRLTEAMNCYRQALALNPKHIAAHGNIADAYKDQGLLDDSIAWYRKALALDPDCMIAHSNILYTLDFCPGVDAAAIFEESQRWYRRFAEPLAKNIKPHKNDRSPDRRLRIGYVSPDFRTHAVGRNFAPLMRPTTITTSFISRSMLSSNGRTR